MRHKRVICICIGVVASVLVTQGLPWWLGQQDFVALQNKSVPRFARLAAPTPDGGSICYQGFGYTLWDLHRLTNFGAGRHGLIVGPSLEYWLPVGLTVNRQQIAVLDKTEEWRWSTEPGGPANRGQPLGSETNRTSAAAGPGG